MRLPVKEYFTDGLLQIAILLSLTRTDLNNLLPGNSVQYPEAQEIMMGPTSAITQSTSFNNFRNTYNGMNIHPKAIDNDVNYILEDLRSLRQYRNWRSQSVSSNQRQEIETYLVTTRASHQQLTQTNQHPTATLQQNQIQHTNTAGLSPAVSDSNTNTPETNVTEDTTAVENQENSSSVNNNFEYDNIQLSVSELNVNRNSLFDQDPTAEDLDLIDVLWRQDIDLGLGKEAFDYNLRQELEKERELELQKERQKIKERQQQQSKSEELQRQQYQQWLAENFSQDGETGEWIPLGGRNQSIPQTQQPVMPNTYNNYMSYDGSMGVMNDQQQQQQHHVHEGNYTMPTHMDMSVPYPQNTPMHTHHSPPQQSHPHTVQDLVQGYNSFNNHHNMNNSYPQPQESLEDRWQDLVNLLELPSTSNNSNSMLTPMNTSTSMAQGNHSQSMSTMVNTSSALIQNATMPLPAQMNNATIPSAFGNNSMQSTRNAFPSTSSITDCQANLDWEHNDIFFPENNVTDNQTDVLAEVERILPDIIADQNLEDFNITEMALNDGLRSMQMLDDNSSESGVSMGSSASPVQDPFSDAAMSPYDGLEGATGGQEYTSAASSPGFNKASSDYDSNKFSNYNSGGDSFSSSNSDGYSNRDDSQSNYSSSSNDTDFNFKVTKTNHIRHNHSYPLQPGQEPREYKKYTITNKDKHRPKGPQCKDARRLSELKVPLSLDEIIETPVEEFNEMLTRHKLTEPQLQLIRDIRRRGKNKVAAQNCRKRKMDVIYTLEDEMGSLKDARDGLLQERHTIDKEATELREKFADLYREIFQSLRDEHGHPYDPQRFSLQQSSDGNVFLVPRNNTHDDRRHGKQDKKSKKHEKK